MSILKVARMGHPVLRTKARGLDRADIKRPAVQSLIDDMIETMIEYHGVGLAAPQVHESVRLFVATIDPVDDERGEPEPVVIINPEITLVGSEIIEDWEGCLSIPTFAARAARPRDRAAAQSSAWRTEELRFIDYRARPRTRTEHLTGLPSSTSGCIVRFACVPRRVIAVCEKGRLARSRF